MISGKVKRLTASDFQSSAEVKGYKLQVIKDDKINSIILTFNFLLLTFNIMPFTRLTISLLILVISTLRVTAVASEKIPAIRDDTLVGTIELRNYNDTRYFSLSNMSKALGARLSWYRISNKVILSVNNKKLSFFFNSKRAAVDTNQFNLDKPAVFVSKDLFIPIEFLLSDKFCKVSDYKVQYEPDKLILIERIDNVYYPRIYTDENFTRLIFEYTEKLRSDLKRNSKKDYSLKIYGGKVLKGKIEYENEQIKQISFLNEGRTAICRIKLKDPNLKLLMEEKDKPSRVIVDIFPEKDGANKFSKSGRLYETVKDTSTQELALSESSYTIVASSPIVAFSTGTQTVLKEKKVKIMLDPGHGGDDPGAIGHNGTKEKEINLKVALEVEKLLIEDGYEVFITRRDDTFIPLVERTNMANEKNVDLFISIHCNASPKKTSTGFEIYFLSEKASDPDAEATARLENAVIKLEGEPSMRKQRLEELLWRLAVNEFMNESSELCSLITAEVTSRIKIENRGIKQAGFFVLRGAQMPAVLVECGFLTNAQEEAKVRSIRFQRNISDSIFSGIRKYVQRKNNLVVKKP
ncbi:MAG: N-acetylmuramoyl-L-alanine amidase [Elusimicrobiota bacterium]